MLKKRVSFMTAALFVLVLMLSFATTVFAAGISVSATVGGSSSMYVGVLGDYPTLNITVSDGGSTFANRRISLSLPSTVKVNRVISGGTNADGTYSLNGSTLSIELYCQKDSSIAYNNTQRIADALRITYYADSSSASASVDVAVKTGTRYAYDINYPLSSGSSNSYYNNLYGYGYGGYGYGGYGYNGYGYPYTYSNLNPSITYGTYGYYVDGQYYSYGTPYNGVYYYDNLNGTGYYGAYDPYSQLNGYYGLTFDRTTLSLSAAQSYQLKLTVGAYGSTYGVNYSSSNASVAAVDSNGLVTGLTSGTATITARSTYGTTATCVVTVGSTVAYGTVIPQSGVQQQSVTSLSFAKCGTTLRVGDVLQMYVTVKPKGVDFMGQQLVSSNPNVVEALEGGVIQAVGKGKATISFSFGGKIARMTFTVK